MNENIKKKIFVIDINPGSDRRIEEILQGIITKSLIKASENDHIVFMCHSNWSICKKIIENIGLKKGFLVCDNGARIYDIDQEKFIYENYIDSSSLMPLVHNGIMLDNVILVSGKENEFSYSLETIDMEALGKLHYIPLASTTSFQDFKNFLNWTEIYSIMYYSKNNEMFQKKTAIVMELRKELNVNVSVYNDGFLIITHKDDNKFDALLKILKITNINNFNNVYYLALSNADITCLKAFRNSLLLDTVKIFKSSKKYVRNIISFEKLKEYFDTQKYGNLFFSGLYFDLVNTTKKY